MCIPNFSEGCGGKASQGRLQEDVDVRRFDDRCRLHQGGVGGGSTEQHRSGQQESSPALVCLR